MKCFGKQCSVFFQKNFQFFSVDYMSCTCCLFCLLSLNKMSLDSNPDRIYFILFITLPLDCSIKGTVNLKHSQIGSSDTFTMLLVKHYRKVLSTNIGFILLRPKMMNPKLNRLLNISHERMPGNDMPSAHTSLTIFIQI